MIGVKQLTQATRGRQAREAGAEALHAPALMIDRDEQWRIARRMNAARELQQLLGAFVVACEEDDAAHQRMREHVALLG